MTTQEFTLNYDSSDVDDYEKNADRAVGERRCGPHPDDPLLAYGPVCVDFLPCEETPCPVCRRDHR